MAIVARECVRRASTLSERVYKVCSSPSLPGRWTRRGCCSCCSCRVRAAAVGANFLFFVFFVFFQEKVEGWIQNAGTSSSSHTRSRKEKKRNASMHRWMGASFSLLPGIFHLGGLR